MRNNPSHHIGWRRYPYPPPQHVGPARRRSAPPPHEKAGTVSTPAKSPALPTRHETGGRGGSGGSGGRGLGQPAEPPRPHPQPLLLDDERRADEPGAGHRQRYAQALALPRHP